MSQGLGLCVRLSQEEGKKSSLRERRSPVRGHVWADAVAGNWQKAAGPGTQIYLKRERREARA